MKIPINSFTTCQHCAHARAVEQIDRDGQMRASREVGYCEMFAQYRALHRSRSCADFKRHTIEEAA